MSHAILLIIFRRPDLTSKVMKVLQQTRPAILRIAADGPRAGVPGESEKCAEARRIAVCSVNWTCKLETDFSESNMGCRRRVVSAITAFLTDHKEGIILEDDCVPDPSFFPFCSEMLDRYRPIEKVMMVCADSLSSKPLPSQYSYRFSNFSMPWAWATWDRAWRLYREDMEGWEDFLASGRMRQLIPDQAFSESLANIMSATKQGKIDTWDYQWVFSYWRVHGLAVVPNVNLVSNLGFGPGATHTLGYADWRFARSVRSLSFPLRHPHQIAVDPAIEAQVCSAMNHKPGMLEKVFQFLRNLHFRATKTIQ